MLWDSVMVQGAPANPMQPAGGLQLQRPSPAASHPHTKAPHRAADKPLACKPPHRKPHNTTSTFVRLGRASQHAGICRTRKQFSKQASKHRHYQAASLRNACKHPTCAKARPPCCQRGCCSRCLDAASAIRSTTLPTNLIPLLACCGAYSSLKSLAPLLS